MTRTDPTDVPRPDATLHFGVFFGGPKLGAAPGSGPPSSWRAHWTVWTLPQGAPPLDPMTFRHTAELAERGMFDAFFIPEGLRLREVDGAIQDLEMAGRPDAITQLCALAAHTKHIGLVTTSNTTFSEPADLARRLSGLDLLSAGRAGWNVVTSDSAWIGENFRRGGYLDHADRYRRAEEFLAVCRQLWDAWPDDVLSPSRDAPSWSRRDAIDRVRYRGQHIDVDARATLPRSPQGHPVIYQAGASSAGREFAARNADVVFSPFGTDFDAALDFAQDIRSRLRTAGRSADDVRIMPGVEVIIGATPKEAEEKARWVRTQQITPALALQMAGALWGMDLTDRDPEGPLPPEEPTAVRNQEHVAEWRALAERHRWSLRDTAIHLGPRTDHVGTPAQLADRFVHFARHGAVDGFNFNPYIIPDGLDDIVELLVPELQERGAYRSAYTATTLRGHLGLGE
ncbi:NtaA/DmoA family FMN-dependent monooxygenase [Streptomyces sp. NPDC096057]|uniref:NtaA/DmoA family FMN-dependent monooxygenase n=1 Tax=Streptomyces sp. NPDC096057 TaxID=3155543 RepID=UPI00331C45BD